MQIVHAAGGLCAYDQANANGILGITRAREAGFDLCHFNLHKTFSTPHGCGGPAAGACGVTADLAPFLPAPTVEFDGKSYYLDFDRPQSIGKVRPWYGVAQNLLRAYAWIMSLGADGLRAVAETAVLNNNYLLSQVLKIRGVSAPYARGRRRIEQVRYSWEQLAEETGVHSEEIGFRAADFGMHYWTSHHPYRRPGADDPGAHRVLIPVKTWTNTSPSWNKSPGRPTQSPRSFTAPRTTAPCTRSTRSRSTIRRHGRSPGGPIAARCSKRNEADRVAGQPGCRPRRAGGAEGQRRGRDPAPCPATGRGARGVAAGGCRPGMPCFLDHSH